jgi:hypothetical protein
MKFGFDRLFRLSSLQISKGKYRLAVFNFLFQDIYFYN